MILLSLCTASKVTADEDLKAAKAPLILELCIDSGKHEIMVAEGQDFRVVTTKGATRRTVEGKVGRIVDGVVPVDFTIELIYRLAPKNLPSPSSSFASHFHRKLTVDHFEGGGGGAIHGPMIGDLWIRRGIDPVPKLVPALANRDQQFYVVTYYLGSLGPQARAAVPELIKALEGENESLNGRPYGTVREAVAKALGHISDDAKTAIPALVESLRDPNGYVRVAAGVALWQITRHADALPTLIEHHKDENGDVRLHAAAALGDIGPDADVAVFALIDALQDDEARVRMHAAYALGGIGAAAKPALPMLRKRLAHPNKDVRRAAEFALKQIEEGKSSR